MVGFGKEFKNKKRKITKDENINCHESVTDNAGEYKMQICGDIETICSYQQE